MPPLQQYVSNVPLTLASNLRFVDSNGIQVTQLLPVGMIGNTVADSPTTGYISRIGAVLSNQIDLYNAVVSTLNAYNTDIVALQADVAALQISGNTIPNVNGYCFTGNAQTPITTVVELLADSTCDYNAILGTVSALTQSVTAEGASTLNSLPSFSQSGSDMTSLAGWITAPTTIADSISNLWYSYLDARAGITTALGAVKTSCSQIIIDFAPVYNRSAEQLSLFFNGYTFIPSGFVDNSAAYITVTDGLGGSYSTSCNLVFQSTSSELVLNLSGSTLATNVTFYNVQLDSFLINYDTGVSCGKTTIKTTSLGSSTNAPDIGNFAFVTTSGTATSFSIISGLSYIPRFVSITPKNTYTGTLLVDYTYYITYKADGATINLVAPTIASYGTFDIDWIAYR